MGGVTRFAAAIIVLAALPAAAAEPLTGKVASVTDGDTVRVLDAAHLRSRPGKGVEQVTR